MILFSCIEWENSIKLAQNLKYKVFTIIFMHIQLLAVAQNVSWLTTYRLITSEPSASTSVWAIKHLAI